MPTYEYICKNCGHTFEELQSIKDDPLLRCPQCHADTLARVMGSGTSLIFKGSGFYLTDYKKTGSASGGSKEKDKKDDAKEKKEKGDAKSKEEDAGAKKGEQTPPAKPAPDKKE